MAALGFIDDEAGASDSGGEGGEGGDVDLLELEKTFAVTKGYDPDGGFIVNDLSEGEGEDSPKGPRKKRGVFERHVVRLLEIAGVDDLDDETEQVVLRYARKHLQIKKKPLPPEKPRRGRSRIRRKRVASSSSSSRD